MSIWFVLWLVLAGGFIYFMGWTFLILMRQKRAWKIYAQKRKLRYKGLAFAQSAEVQGAIGEHSVTVFASEHLSEDLRGSRKLSAIEVSLNSVMPVTGGVASAAMISVLKSLNLKQEYSPKYEKWNKTYVAAANSRNVMAAYLTDARLAVLCDLMAIKNAAIILVFKEEAMLLRIDTPDPLDTPAKVDKLVKSLLSAAEVLELQSGESRVLKEESVKADVKNVELAIDDDALDASMLELEGDEDQSLDVNDAASSDDVSDTPKGDKE